MKNRFLTCIAALSSLSGIIVAGCGGLVRLSPSPSPSVVISSSSLAFGAALTGTSSAAQYVVLSNVGSSNANVLSIALSGADANQFSVSSSCSSTVPAGGDCTISVHFNPTKAGDYSANLKIVDDATARAHTILLTGLAPPGSVTVSPTAATLRDGQAVQLTAIVTNEADTKVIWSISPAGVGSIDSGGLYVAPVKITTALTVMVTAASRAAAAAHSTVILNLQPSVAVSVRPSTLVLTEGQTAQLTSAVVDADDTSVVWSIHPVGVGFISLSGLYTAPSSISNGQSVTVTATSQENAMAAASSVITLEPSVRVRVSPLTMTLVSGQAAQMRAAVTNGVNDSVTWTALLGTITPEGLYTAPSITGDNRLTDTIKATSKQDSGQFGTATVSVSLAPSTIPSDDDEFVGPFSSWLNVKTNFGAVGNGVTDDTNAFQLALNALGAPSSHASVLYIPAGSYKITSGLTYMTRNCGDYCMGKSIIGEDPTKTIVEWKGADAGPALLTLDGINRMQLDRLTFDGGGSQITLVNETMHQGCCYDGSNEYTDDVFQNAAIGIQAGDNTVGCCSAETKVDRDSFLALTQAGISLEDGNALNWYVRYSTFKHDRYGVTNRFGGGGAMHLDHNLFEYNDIDSAWGNGTTQSYTYNTSYHSGTFLAASPFGNSSILIGNTILMPEVAAITMPGVGPLTLINNTIEGIIKAENVGQATIFADGTTSNPECYITSVGNTYVSTTPFSVQNVPLGIDGAMGNLTSIEDIVIPTSELPAALPLMPGALPNHQRPIYDVPQGASGVMIQTTIDQAIAENNGRKPIVHIPWGEYSVTSTILIPANSDVQIVGDNLQTTISWNGSTSSPVMALLGPSHAEIRNLMINASSASAGILVEGPDQRGDRIFTNFVAGAGGVDHNLLVNGFDNTLIQMDDFAHGSINNPSSASVVVTGGPLSQQGQGAPGYTGLFMGASCCDTNSYRVQNGGTLVLTGFWYEQGGPGWLNLDNTSGNFIGYEDVIGLVGPAPSLSAINFTGSLTLANTFMGGSYLNIAGSTLVRTLMLADEAVATEAVAPVPLIVGTNTNPESELGAFHSTWELGGGHFAVPAQIVGYTPLNNLLKGSLLDLARYKDPAIADLPLANEDVRMIDVVVNGGANSLDFEAVAATGSVQPKRRDADSARRASKTSIDRCNLRGMQGIAKAYNAGDRDRKSGLVNTQACPTEK